MEQFSISHMDCVFSQLDCFLISATLFPEMAFSFCLSFFFGYFLLWLPVFSLAMDFCPWLTSIYYVTCPFLLSSSFYVLMRSPPVSDSSVSLSFKEFCLDLNILVSEWLIGSAWPIWRLSKWQCYIISSTICLWMMTFVEKCIFQYC